MSLILFPAEVLALILNGPNSYLVLELWKCGNRVLNHRLCNGGITDIVLKADQSSKTSRWPRCLKEFRLESLSVFSEETGVCTTPTLRNELIQLHRGLRSLELAFDGCTRALCGLAFSTFDADDADDADDASSEENYDEPPAKRAKYSDGYGRHLSLWPLLERLVLREEIYNKIPFNAVDPYLPRSLTHLELSGGFVFHCYDDADAYDLANLNVIFPPRLKTLLLPSCSLHSDMVECLPATLTDIGSSLSEEALMLYLRQPSLLPNLRTVNFTEILDQEAIPTEWFEELDAWPTFMTSMTIRDCIEQFFTGKKELPSRLSSLSLISLVEPCMCEAWIDLLMPLPITYLDIAIIDWTGTLSHGSAIESWMWPPTLQILRLNPRNFDTAWLYKLPRALTQLDCSSNYGCAEVKKPKFNLPLLLENGVSALNGPDKELWQSIRREILRKSGTPDEMLAIETYLKDVESGRLFGLPLTLKTMNLDDSMAVPSTLTTMILPPRLTDLGIHNRYPPKNMFELRNSDLEWLHDEDENSHVDEANPPMSALHSAFNLKSYTGVFGSTDSLHSLKSLPRQLETLYFTVYVESENTSQHWQQCAFFDLLPTTLTKLRLTFKEVSSTKLERPEILPRTLTELETSLSIEGRDFALLPPGLLYLYVSINHVSIDDLLSLPRHLRRLEYKNRPRRSRSNDLPFEHLEELLCCCRPYYRIYGVERAVLEHICSVTYHTPTAKEEMSSFVQNLASSVLRSAVRSTTVVSSATISLGKWFGRKIWSNNSMQSSDSIKVSGEENESSHGNFEGQDDAADADATNDDEKMDEDPSEDVELDTWGRVLPHSQQSTDIDPFTPLLLNGLPDR